MNDLWDFLRVCHGCGKYEFKPTDLLCDICNEKLYKESLLSQKQLFLNSDIKAFSWCHWKKSNDTLLRPVIYALKQGRLNKAIFSLCEQAAFDLPHLFKTKPILIPAPAKTTSNKDHAYQIANSFSKIFHLQIVRAFERVNPKDLQKTKTKKQRQQTNLILKKSLSQNEKALLFDAKSSLLFVDDLITTGATVKHAHNALKQAKNFSAFSLFYRPLGFNDE